MSKHVREKCGKLCIFSFLSSKRGITPTKIDVNWWHSNLICSTVKQIHMQNFSSMCQSKLEKSVENWRTETRTESQTDGWRVGRTDGHHHTIIRPVWRRAYKKQVKIMNLTNNASPHNEICTYISYFMPVQMKLCQSKQADLLFSASLLSSWRLHAVAVIVKCDYYKLKCDYHYLKFDYQTDRQSDTRQTDHYKLLC